MPSPRTPPFLGGGLPFKEDIFYKCKCPCIEHSQFEECSCPTCTVALETIREWDRQRALWYNSWEVKKREKTWRWERNHSGLRTNSAFSATNNNHSDLQTIYSYCVCFTKNTQNLQTSLFANRGSHIYPGPPSGRSRLLSLPMRLKSWQLLRLRRRQFTWHLSSR